MACFAHVDLLIVAVITVAQKTTEEAEQVESCLWCTGYSMVIGTDEIQRSVWNFHTILTIKKPFPD